MIKKGEDEEKEKLRLSRVPAVQLAVASAEHFPEDVVVLEDFGVRVVAAADLPAPRSTALHHPKWTPGVCILLPPVVRRFSDLSLFSG